MGDMHHTAGMSGIGSEFRSARILEGNLSDTESTRRVTRTVSENLGLVNYKPSLLKRMLGSKKTIALSAAAASALVVGGVMGMAAKDAVQRADAVTVTAVHNASGAQQTIATLQAQNAALVAKGNHMRDALQQASGQLKTDVGSLSQAQTQINADQVRIAGAFAQGQNDILRRLQCGPQKTSGYSWFWGGGSGYQAPSTCSFNMGGGR